MSEKTKKAKYRASKTADKVELMFDALPGPMKSAAVLEFGYACAKVKAVVSVSRIEHYKRAASMFSLSRKRGGRSKRAPASGEGF